jgi:hypothetical protein
MRVLVGEVRSGKTTELVKMAASQWLYIVCPTKQRIDNIMDIARRIGADIPFPITFREYAERRYHPRGIKGFVFDDLDHCVATLSGSVPVVGFSICEPVHSLLKMQKP